MNKSLAIAMMSGAAFASMGANSYSRGIPPTTQNCNSYPSLGATGTDFDAQNTAWGLQVDREFGGCRCADEDEMEFQPNPANYEDNMWSCRCLNNDLYPSQPEGLYKCWDPSTGRETSAVLLSRTWRLYPAKDQGQMVDNLAASCPVNMVARLNDTNGKKCGIIAECQLAAVEQQRTRWNLEAARASMTKESAKTYALKSLLPEDEMDHARTLRMKMTKENRMRARVQVASIAMKYRAVKNAMIAGAIDKASFEKAYKLTASQIAVYRAQFTTRQAAIEESWKLIVKRQQAAEAYLSSDLSKIEEIYEQTLASLADRYGKRLAYFQSLPIIKNLNKCHPEGVSVPNAAPLAVEDACDGVRQKSTSVCPIYEDGMAA